VHVLQLKKHIWSWILAKVAEMSIISRTVVYIRVGCICITRYIYVELLIHFFTMVASLEDDTTDSLPDRNFSKEFYANYEPKDVLGRYVYTEY